MSAARPTVTVATTLGGRRAPGRSIATLVRVVVAMLQMTARAVAFGAAPLNNCRCVTGQLAARISPWTSGLSIPRTSCCTGPIFLGVPLAFSGVFAGRVVSGRGRTPEWRAPRSRRCRER